jgi:hypothetical protein
VYERVLRGSLKNTVWHIIYATLEADKRPDDSVQHLAQEFAEEFIFEWEDNTTPDVANSAMAAQALQRLWANEIFSKLKQFTGIRLPTSAE